MLTKRVFLTGAAALAAGARLGRAAESPYPTRTIRIMVGYAAGGGVDIVARLIGDPMGRAFHQTIIVEDRPGASAMIASNIVAKAEPDGYTLLAAASGEVAINQHIFKTMTYDPDKDLVPFCLVGIVPCVVVVAEKTPVHNPKELIAYARANPGKLSFSSSGVGNPQQLAGELMNTMADIKVLHVPYRGSAPAVTDVAGGVVTMSFSSLAAALPLIKGGQLRAVAVTSKERLEQLPDVAPLSEGDPKLAGYELLNWFAMFAPAKTPRDILEKLNREANAAIKSKPVGDKLTVQGIIPRPMDLDQVGAFVRSESAKFAKIAKAANIQVSN
jgi:tripartite-type tricarboxylate transporter receptor subunit TctC